MSEPRAVTAIVNPAAGKGRARRYAERLRQALPSAEIRFTERPGHAAELAAEAAAQGAEIVAAMGGDGTAREVASGVIGSDAALGVVPLGSGNDFARSLNIPLQLDAALETLASGEIRAVDAGEDADGLFICMSAVGFAAEAARHAGRSRLFRGSAGYAAGVVKAVLHMRPSPMRLYLDGEPRDLEALFVMAQNIPFCGGGQLMAPDAQLDDGLLDVIVVEPVSRLELLRIFPRVYTGRHLEHPACSCFRAASVRIESERPLLKLLDGDLAGDGPLDSRVQPRALKVAVPSPASSGSSGSSDS